MASNTKKTKRKVKFLSSKEITAIKKAYRGGEKTGALAITYGVHADTIRRKVKGITVADKSSAGAENKKIIFRHIDPSRTRTPLVLHEFIVWMGVPSMIRSPRTQQEFGKKYGVNDDTLSTWKGLPRFWDEVAEHSFHGSIREHVIDVLLGLAIKGKLGDAKAADTFLRAVEPNKYKNRLQVEIDDPLNDERMAEISEAVGAWGKFIKPMLPTPVDEIENE